MENDDASKVEGVEKLQNAESSVVAIAINGNKKSKYIIKWALENFIPQGDTRFKLLHVFPQITAVPTPMGTSIPISQVRDDVATAYRKEVEWQTNEKIVPYKMMFIKRNLQVDMLLIEADDISKALAEEVSKSNTKKLVIGSSSVGMFSRGHQWSSKISECSPSFCTVYVVSKGKLSSVRPGYTGTNENIRDDRSDTSSTTNASSHSSSSPTERTDRGSTASYALQSSASPLHRAQVPSTALQIPRDKEKDSNDITKRNISAHDTREDHDGSRNFFGSSENNNESSQSSYSYARSPTRPMKRFPAFPKNQAPLSKSPNSSGNYYPPPSSPSGAAEDDANFSRRNSDFNHASYSHMFPASSTKTQAPLSKSPNSSGNNYPPPTSPSGAAEDNPRNSDFNHASYSHMFPAFSTKTQAPLSKSPNSGGNNYLPPPSPSGAAEDNARNSDFNNAYSHMQSRSPTSQRFQSTPTKNQTPGPKIPHSAANISPRELYLETGESEHVRSSYYSISDENDSSTRVSFSPFKSHSLPTQQFQAPSLKDPALLQKSTNSFGNSDSRDFGQREDYVMSSPGTPSANDVNIQNLSFRSSATENYFNSWTPDEPSSSVAPTNYSSGTQVNANFELERLRMELRHMQGLYSIAQSEVIDASHKLNDLQKSRIEEEIKLKEVTTKEEESKEIAKQEKEKYEAAKKEADYAKECAEKESALRKQADDIASREAKEKEKLENALVSPVHQYQIFSWEEIVLATESFSENHRVGMGSYGIVYKCRLRHTTAAVKVLHSMEGHRTKQFEQELEILSRIRHPNLLTLLGTCPERGSLVYEYMENGNLEERLLRNNNTLPLPWFERYRIAQEVASALLFLHSSKPKPIIHRDLKPANILLDHNFVSKIGDVGLSTVVQPDPAVLHTIYKDSSPVGTLCYIDPEYQRTGQVSQKSDVYALGMVMLQLLTAKQAIALTFKVEEAIEDEKLQEILDPEAGEWPPEETNELALLALKCTEIRSRDRPDLKGEILPTLEKLRVIADKARVLAFNGPTKPPSHFICPLLKDVMNAPCVASDGYTYDRKAIEVWLEENDTSPVTNEPLPHKHLIPNITLFLAIMEWKKSGGRH